MKVKIFQPAKSAMQSGKKNRKKWLVEPIASNNVRSINPLMGWISAANTNSQLHFEFSSKEEAVKFAQSKGFKFEIHEPHTASIKPKSYAENFTG
jgi:hypothetical protein